MLDESIFRCHQTKCDIRPFVTYHLEIDHRRRHVKLDETHSEEDCCLNIKTCALCNYQCKQHYMLAHMLKTHLQECRHLSFKNNYIISCRTNDKQQLVFTISNVMQCRTLLTIPEMREEISSQLLRASDDFFCDAAIKSFQLQYTIHHQTSLLPLLHKLVPNQPNEILKLIYEFINELSVRFEVKIHKDFMEQTLYMRYRGKEYYQFKQCWGSGEDYKFNAQDLFLFKDDIIFIPKGNIRSYSNDSYYMQYYMQQQFMYYCFFKDEAATMSASN